MRAFAMIPGATATLALAVLLTVHHHGAADAGPMHAGLDYQRYLAEADKVDAELDAWMKKFGGDAEKNGWLPQTESRSADEIHEDRKQRFFLAKELVTRLEQENPEAQFSTDSPFSLMTTEEFAAFSRNKYLAEAANATITRRLRDSWPIQPRRRLAEHVFNFIVPPSDPEPSDDAQPETPPNEQPSDDAAPEPTDGNEGALEGDGVDWSNHECMAPIQNQGQCGSCWAFATVSAVETGACLANGGNFHKFSEQYVAGCDGASNGCDGGVAAFALRFMQDGVCSAQESQYAAQDGELGCDNSCNKIHTGLTGHEPVTNEAALVAALNSGPVVIALSSGNEAWKQYRGGVLSACDSIEIDHFVLAVGYDASSIKIRNSWGTSWGEGGYMRLQRTGEGPGMCGMYQFMSRAVF